VKGIIQGYIPKQCGQLGSRNYSKNHGIEEFSSNWPVRYIQSKIMSSHHGSKLQG